MSFEVYRKRGRNWEPMGVVNAKSSRHAAYHLSYVHNLKVVGVRPEGATTPIQVHRLMHVATLSYA